jgi:hypothetical protein
VRFSVRGSARALESYTTGTLDVWTVPSEDQPLVFAPRANRSGVMVAGGGTQLIIPRSFAVLRRGREAGRDAGARLTGGARAATLPECRCPTKHCWKACEPG